jgi:tetratricopeptide (TPR) repeat protein
MRTVRMLLAALWPAAAFAALSLAALPAQADKKLDEAVARAEAQLAKGNDAEAVRILEKEIARVKTDPEPPLALATMLVRLGRLDQAAAALGTADERIASAPAALKARVRTSQSALALRSGTAPEALEYAQEAVQAAAGPDSLAALARAQARLGLGPARETAERAVKAGPDSAAAQVASGDALLAARLPDQAEAAYRRAVQLDARSADAHTGLALALAARRQPAPALEEARAAAQADPRSAEAKAALGMALLARDPADANGEAVAALQEASSLEPKNALVKLELGRVLESRGQLDRAGAVYAEAAELDRLWPAPRLAALELRSRQGDVDGALAKLRSAPEEFRATGDGELLLGRLLVQKEDWAGALAALEKAAASLPGLAEAHALLGDAAYNSGELTRAADAYARAVELDPGNLAYQATHALYLTYDGRKEEARTALAALSERPEGQRADVFLALGAIYRSDEPPRVAEAVAAYEKALKLDPKSSQAALGIARTWRAARQWARAISAYERVQSSFPRREREALLGIAWCYYLSGDDTRARFYTGTAARAGADVAGIRQVLGRAPAGALDEGDRADLVEGLRSKNAGVQARSVKGLLDLGRAGVPALAAALARPGTSLPARELIVQGLGEMGPTAREALPQLDRVAAGAPKGSAPGESREARLAASARAAIRKIRGRP